MNRNSITPILAAFAILVLRLGVVMGQDAVAGRWTGKLEDGTVVDEEWMVAFLAAHRQAVANWNGTAHDYWQPLRKASLDGIDLASIASRAAAAQPVPWPGATELPSIDLSDASLDHANVAGLSLIWATLDRTRLRDASLSGAVFAESGLLKADFSRSNLQGAYFREVDATEASFASADLRGAVFYCSTLHEGSFMAARAEGMNVEFSVATKVRFYEASLRGTNLFDVDVSQATFHSADLEGVRWGAHGRPALAWLVQSKNLETLTHDWWGEAGLVELRKAFKEDGFRDGERKINYAIQRTQTDGLWNFGWDGSGPKFWDRVEVVFRKVFFDWTCRYGLDPGRALKLIAWLCLAFAFPYAAFILRKPRASQSTHDGAAGATPAPAAGPVSGIWAVPLEKRVFAGPSEPTLVHVDIRRDGVLRGLWKAAALGLFFSVISAFSTGYRDLDVGRWIERIKREESTLRGTGWVRTFSGVQSLLSFYLLALWLLTYFGRPFE